MVLWCRKAEAVCSEQNCKCFICCPQAVWATWLDKPEFWEVIYEAVSILSQQAGSDSFHTRAEQEASGIRYVTDWLILEYATLISCCYPSCTYLLVLSLLVSGNKLRRTRICNGKPIVPRRQTHRQTSHPDHCMCLLPVWMYRVTRIIVN